VPLIHDARAESRKHATSATSSAVPSLPCGNSSRTHRPNASGSLARRWSQPPPGNRIDPGLSALTRIPSGPSSRPSDAARWISAAFAAAYCARGWGRVPEIDAMKSVQAPTVFLRILERPAEFG